MIYELLIELPQNRYNAGTFRLYGPDGRKRLFGECLGKADNARAAKASNPMRWAHAPYGDTPTGVYKPAAIQLFGVRHARLGSGWLPLDGELGQALYACTEGGRSGLGLHAGREGAKLIPTYGCIRVLEETWSALCMIAGTAQIRTVIVERGKNP